MRDPVYHTRIRRKSKKAVYLVNNLLPNGVPRQTYNVRTFHAMRRAGVPMKSPMTRKPITKGWKRVLKNSELPLGTERARLRTYMKNKMKLTAAQKANYIKRLNNGESFNEIINTINRTTVPKTNFKSPPPYRKSQWLKSIGDPLNNVTIMTKEQGKILRTYIMQELADLVGRISKNVPKVYQARTKKLVKYAMDYFVREGRQAERDLITVGGPSSPDFFKKGIRKTQGETFEKVAKAGMGIISRHFSIWLTKNPYPEFDEVPVHWGLGVVDDIEEQLVHSRQKIIVTAMMRAMRLSFSQLNKEVQNLMKRETRFVYRDPIQFAKKYLLPLTREHKAAKTIQKVVRGGQVRNKIRKNVNNLRKKVNRAEKLRSVVQASKKRKTPTPTPASSTRIKK